MKITKKGIAGTLESSDVLVTVSPPTDPGIKIELESIVKKQFGNRIIAVVNEVLEGLGIKDVHVSLQDKGALDCTVRARLEAAAYRAAGISQMRWRR
ncbi:citrate lyase acyl carrier protein [Marispirochaeta aestuarii]|uniref:Citrate lyase acyl carrier protein n=1 Tax=Marispirochaeta aestuarii TaxID=1963862 RepID=A0A1Y1RYA4_9SPIO|nr:citrate lyase acyl carrier protein [Marispirochaeta aestuarii]ORC35396.1 citrate lyase acyl carrier protein [Marispirochaeta aestuarii]